MDLVAYLQIELFDAIAKKEWHSGSQASRLSINERRESARR